MKKKDEGAAEASSPGPTHEERVHADLMAILEDKTTSPPVAGVLRWFRFRDEPLTLEQRTMAMRAAELAIVVAMLPPNAEVVVALRELLRFRDQVCRAVRQ